MSLPKRVGRRGERGETDIDAIFLPAWCHRLGVGWEESGWRAVGGRRRPGNDLGKEVTKMQEGSPSASGVASSIGTNLFRLSQLSCWLERTTEMVLCEWKTVRESQTISLESFPFLVGQVQRIADEGEGRRDPTWALYLPRGPP